MMQLKLMRGQSRELIALPTLSAEQTLSQQPRNAHANAERPTADRGAAVVDACPLPTDVSEVQPQMQIRARQTVPSLGIRALELSRAW